MAKRITEIDGKELRYSRDYSAENVKYYKDIGYKPPFRLLLDGSVVEDLIQNDFERLASVASKILKEDVLIYVTRCSVGEAKLSQARETPHCIIAKCDHPQDITDDEECIRKVIGVDNSAKFFLVTNEERVARNYANLQIAYGVPVMLHSPKGLCLMPPGNKDQQELNEQEQREKSKRKRNKLRKMRQMEAAKKEGDGYFDQAAVYSRKKAANRARKRQRELEEQQQQQQQQEEAEA